MTDPSEPRRHLGDEVRGPRRRRARSVTGAAAIVVLVVSAAVMFRDAPTSTAVRSRSGERAPSFELPSLTDAGRSIAFPDESGRPVVLNFFASWCVPCRREMPAFQSVYEDLRKEVEFIGINHQDRREDALDLLADTGVTYPTGHDPAGEVARTYGLYGMPTTVFVSSDGEIVGRRTGEMDVDELEQTIRELLLDGSG